METAPSQYLVVEAEPLAVPEQQLQPVAATPPEAEDRRTDEQASLLMATNRMAGRVTASQMAAASTASVFPRFT